MIISTTMLMQFTRFLGKELSYNDALLLAKTLPNSRIVATRRTRFWAFDNDEVWKYLSNHHIYKKLIQKKEVVHLQELYERTMQYLGENDALVSIRNKRWRMASYNPNFSRDDN